MLSHAIILSLPCSSFELIPLNVTTTQEHWGSDKVISRITPTSKHSFKYLQHPYSTVFAVLCNSLGNCNHSKLNSLFIIQKRAVRNICKLKYLTRTAPYFKNVHILTIFDTLQVSQLMFKVTFNLLPSSLVTYLQINSAVHS